MRWSNLDAVDQILRDTARVPDTYITISHMLPGGREAQVGSHPWEDWEDVHRWLKKAVRSLDPGPEGVKVRTRVFKKGGKPLRSVVSVITGNGRGPGTEPRPAPSETFKAVAPVEQSHAPHGVCPSCVATQALLATRQLQVVELEARLEHARRQQQETTSQLASTRGELDTALHAIAKLRRRVSELERDQAEAITVLDTFYATHGDAA